jgi:hypothetical protein
LLDPKKLPISRPDGRTKTVSCRLLRRRSFDVTRRSAGGNGLPIILNLTEGEFITWRLEGVRLAVFFY